MAKRKYSDEERIARRKICSKKYKDNNKEKTRQYYLDNKEEINKGRREDRLNNPDEYKLKSREYYQKNKDKFSDYGKKNYLKHREDFLEKSKLQRLKNPEEYTEYLKKYYLNNKDTLKNKSSKWKKENKDKVNVQCQKRRSLKRSAEGSFTIEEWLNLKKKFNFTCPVCLRSEPEIMLTIDHVIPLSKSGSNYIINIQPLCRSCNCSKRDRIN